MKKIIIVLFIIFILLLLSGKIVALCKVSYPNPHTNSSIKLMKASSCTNPEYPVPGGSYKRNILSLF